MISFYKYCCWYATTGKIFVLDGKTGSIIFQYLFGNELSYRADRVSKLNSIDGNLTAEFMGGCRDGRIKCFSGGPNQPIGIQSNSNSIPKKYKLYQNYPNPFNPSTTIKFDIPTTSHSSVTGVEVSLAIYDLLGRKIIELINAKLTPGSYEVSWTTSKIASGIYFYKLSTDDFVSVKKLILLK